MAEPLTYEQFRTGLTYGDVYHLIYSRPHKRRHGVLGYWRELKQRMYAEYLRQHEEGSEPAAAWVDDGTPIPD